MKWVDLNLPEAVEQTLRKDWGLDKPEQVVSLAWGSPQVLHNVLPKRSVDDIRGAWSSPTTVPYDSSQFALGARFGPPAGQVSDDAAFEHRRQVLLDDLANAPEGSAQDDAHAALIDLYRSQGNNEV